MWTRIGAALAAVLLAACDDVTDEIDPYDDYRDRLEASAALDERVRDLPVATADEMPMSGGATYRGYATLVAGPGAETSLVGDARLRADFGEETIRGRVSDVVGRVEGGGVQGLDGTLAIADGRIGLAAPSSFDAALEGTLEAGDDVVEVDGTLVGAFRSEEDRDAAALTAVSGVGTDIVVNGTERDGLVSVAAER